MLGTMAMAVALASLGAAQPAPGRAPAVVNQPAPLTSSNAAGRAVDGSNVDEPSASCGGQCGECGGCGGCSSCGGGCQGCGHCSLHGAMHNLFWRSHSTCDMAPPEWSCAETHGYYYFRPYNYGHVAAHQEFASAWGIDPRNPYSNEFLKTVYEQVEEKWRLETENPAGSQVEEIVPEPRRGQTSQKPGAFRPASVDRRVTPASPSSATARESSRPVRPASSAAKAAKSKAAAAPRVSAKSGAAKASAGPAPSGGRVSQASAVAPKDTAQDHEPQVVRGWQAKTSR